MQYSGILVVANPVHIAECQSSLEQLPGIEIYYCEPESGRLVVVQESETASDQELGLRRIQELPLVRAAALVEHRVD